MSLTRVRNTVIDSVVDTEVELIALTGYQHQVVQTLGVNLVGDSDSKFYRWDNNAVSGTLLGTKWVPINLFGQSAGTATYESVRHAGDGTTTVFTLPTGVTNPDDDAVGIYINGVRQRVTDDFTIGSSQITFLTAPEDGDQIDIYGTAIVNYGTYQLTKTRTGHYIYLGSESGVIPVQTVLASSYEASSVTSGTYYAGNGNLEVFLNGVRQILGVDYTEESSGTTITFIVEPNTDDVVTLKMNDTMSNLYNENRFTVLDAINAKAGGGQLEATTLINGVNVITTALADNDSVRLPLAAAGMQCIIINNSGFTLAVFPNIGDDLGSGVDTSTTLTNGSAIRYTAYNDQNWINV